MAINIRKARLEDVAAIVQVHFSAVHESAAPFYSAEILAAWSRQPDEQRYEWLRGVLSKGEDLFFVAEDRSGIIGFGAIVPGASELRALYVHPKAGRQGIGRALLHELERQAALSGIHVLRLNASLNAEPFYRHHGYQSDGPGRQRLSTGQEMDCIKMQKILAAGPK